MSPEERFANIKRSYPEYYNTTYKQPCLNSSDNLCEFKLFLQLTKIKN